MCLNSVDVSVNLVGGLNDDGGDNVSVIAGGTLHHDNCVEQILEIDELLKK